MITSLILTCVILLLFYMAVTYIAPFPEPMPNRLLVVVFAIIAILCIARVWNLTL